MRENFLNARDYVPKEGDVFLVDTNVLVCLFTPFTDTDKSIGRQYEDFIINRNPKLVIPSMVLSEFVSTNLKNKYNIFKGLNGIDIAYKEYRMLPEFEEELEHLKNVIDRQILKIMEKTDDDFTEIDIMECFSGAAESFDFSDKYYVELAKRKGLKILTNDFDFSVVKDVDIVTTNNKFFKLN